MADYKKKLTAALIGNAMQFYDFTIYAFLATEISNEFFNFKDQFLSYLVVFCVFASGYLTRPLGALIFGRFGDTKGRSNALSITIFFSSIATFLIGVIPGFAAWGIVAPIILIILRLVQGIAVSGEEGGAIVLLFESDAFKNSGFIGSFVLSSVLVGVLFGMVTCLVINTLISNHILGAWGWRLPFLLALPFGLVGVMLRVMMNDTKLFSLAKKSDLVLKNPIQNLLKNHKWTILFCVSLISVYSIMTSTL